MGKFITIKTDIPGPRSKEILEKRKRCVTGVMSSLAPFYIAEGKGALVRDVDGNQFIDFTEDGDV